MPTLLIWGARDAVIPYQHARLAHAAMPGSRLDTFEQAGHFPHHSDPPRFERCLREFLASTDEAAYVPEAWRELLRRGRCDSLPSMAPPPPPVRAEAPLIALDATASGLGMR
jgi:hypothetical protein